MIQKLKIDLRHPHRPTAGQISVAQLPDTDYPVTAPDAKKIEQSAIDINSAPFGVIWLKSGAEGRDWVKCSKRTEVARADVSLGSARPGPLAVRIPARRRNALENRLLRFEKRR